MKTVFIISGLLSFSIGMVGIILPILPTTPFLLLTGFFFSKSSDKANNWFLSTRVYQKYLKEFVENKAMTKKQKWTILLFVDVVMIISFISVTSIYLKIIIVVVEIVKYYYFTYHIETI